jgi:hypothetical protein
LDAPRISKYTGKKCELSRGVGAQFLLLDGLITGFLFHFFFFPFFFLSFFFFLFYFLHFLKLFYFIFISFLYFSQFFIFIYSSLFLFRFTFFSQSQPSHLTGTIVELVTDSKISQEWRCNDWTEPHTSKLVITLRRVPLGSELSFSQVSSYLCFFSYSRLLLHLNFSTSSLFAHTLLFSPILFSFHPYSSLFTHPHTHIQLNVPVEKYKAVTEIWDKYFWKNIRKEIKNNYDALTSTLG